MTNPSKRAAGLDDVLGELHDRLEDGATPTDLWRFAEEHAEFRDEVLAFAAQWLSTQGSDLGDEAPTGNYTAAEHHLILERFWAGQATTVDPFAALGGDQIERLASACRIDTGILRKLMRRLIDEASLPGKLVARLSTEIGCASSELSSFLAGAPISASADFFAPSGKRTPGKMSFADAVRASTLPPEDKRYWLPELEA